MKRIFFRDTLAFSRCLVLLIRENKPVDWNGKHCRTYRTQRLGVFPWKIKIHKTYIFNSLIIPIKLGSIQVPKNIRFRFVFVGRHFNVEIRDERKEKKKIKSMWKTISSSFYYTYFHPFTLLDATPVYFSFT